MASARSAFSGETGAKSKAFHDAEAACAINGKLMKLVNVSTHECALHGGCGEAQITYMCLSKDDPRY